jgi:hypothetical protein
MLLKYLKSFTGNLLVFSDIELQSVTVKNVPDPIDDYDIVSRNYVNSVTTKRISVDNTGTTDVTNDINTVLLTATAGDIVFLPAGIYKVSSTISIPRNVKFVGENDDVKMTNYVTSSTNNKGTVLSVDPSTTTNIISMSENSVVRGIDFLYPRVLSSNTTNTFQPTINAVNVSGCVVRNCGFNICTSGINISGCDNFSIKEISGFSTNKFITPNNCENLSITDITFAPQTYVNFELSNLYNAVKGTSELIDATNCNILVSDSYIECDSITLENCDTKISSVKLTLYSEITVSGDTNELFLNDFYYFGESDHMIVVSSGNGKIFLNNGSAKGYSGNFVHYNGSIGTGQLFINNCSTVNTRTNASGTGVLDTSTSIETSFIDTLSYTTSSNIDSTTTLDTLRLFRGSKNYFYLSARVIPNATGVRGSFTFELPGKLSNFSDKTLFWSINCSTETTNIPINDCIITPQIGTKNIQVFITLPQTIESVLLSINSVY